MPAAAKATIDDDAPTTVPTVEKKKKGLLPAIVIAIVVSAGLSGGVAWYVSKSSVPAVNAKHPAEEAKPESRAPAIYLPLTPALVVNLQDDDAMRFLQADIEVMSRDAAAIEAVTKHMPRIRNSLLMLLGAQRAPELVSRADKERLQGQVLAEVRRILEEETGHAGVEAIYFTSFVMQ